MQLTDVVVVVQMCPYPLVLRPRAERCRHTLILSEGESFCIQTATRLRRALDAPNEFTFIGEYYVDGVMHGEAAAARRDQGGRDMTFIVR